MLGSAATLVVTSEEEISWPQNPVFVSTLDLHCFQIYGEALSRDAVEKSAAYCNNGNTTCVHCCSNQSIAQVVAAGDRHLVAYIQDVSCLMSLLGRGRCLALHRANYGSANYASTRHSL